LETKILGEIHDFWFGKLTGPFDYPKEKSEIWFKKSDETDDYIRNTFGSYVAEAARSEWDLDALTREEQVGLVILLDQFPRNVFRTSGESFAYDPTARAIARRLVERGRERFFLIERAFLCLPFEHSEDMADHDYSVFLASEAALAAPEALKSTFRNFLSYATKHRDVIVKFGRYPHRNQLLGRESTPEEEAFIEEHGRGF
jgi:uncharacterized protein (DUF924 family)